MASDYVWSTNSETPAGNKYLGIIFWAPEVGTPGTQEMRNYFYPEVNQRFLAIDPTQVLVMRWDGQERKCYARDEPRTAFQIFPNGTPEDQDSGLVILFRLINRVFRTDDVRTTWHWSVDPHFQVPGVPPMTMDFPVGLVYNREGAGRVPVHLWTHRY